MTPKEKAQELVDEYILYANVFNKNLGWIIDIEFSKKCALIAVNEILNLSNPIKFPIRKKSTLGYWYKVKQEIENL
jgi:hypothetical protein